MSGQPAFRINSGNLLPSLDVQLWQTEISQRLDCPRSPWHRGPVSHLVDDAYVLLTPS
jgi:hypothetical protein